MNAEEVSRERAGRGDRLPGGEAVIGQERDLVRDGADDIGAGQYPHSVGHGIREAVTETLAQLVDRLRTSGSGESRFASMAQSVGVHAPPRAPSASSSEWPSALPCSIESAPIAVSPESGRLLCTATLAPAAWAASTAWRSVPKSYVAAVDCGTGPSYPTAGNRR